MRTFPLHQIKHDEIDGWNIYSVFQRFSLDPDVPMFWEVSWCAGNPYMYGERRFGTKEAALEFHASLVSGKELLGGLISEDDDEEDRANWWKE